MHPIPGRGADVRARRLDPSHAFSSVLLVALAGACGTPASHADAGSGVDAGPRTVVTDQRVLHVGELAEATLIGGPPDRVVIHLSAPTADLDWNLHGHQNGGTQTIDEALQQMVVDYDFAPTAAADWYLLIRNSGAATMTVDVRLELYGDMGWGAWQ